jgi:hypothetical protein
LFIRVFSTASGFLSITIKEARTALSGRLRPQTQRSLRAVPTRSKSLSLVTKVAFLAWPQAAKQAGAKGRF